MAPARVFKRERFSDRRLSDNKADQIFLSYLYDHFGDKPFIRGNLDAGRISWLFEREVKSFDKNYDIIINLVGHVSNQSFLNFNFKEMFKTILINSFVPFLIIRNSLKNMRKKLIYIL